MSERIVGSAAVLTLPSAAARGNREMGKSPVAPGSPQRHLVRPHVRRRPVGGHPQGEGPARRAAHGADP